MKLKVILQLTIVLVLGFFIGFLTHGSIVSNKIKNYSWRRGEVTFWSQSLKEANVSQEQRDKIMPIVVKYSEQGHELMRQSMMQVEPLWGKMEAEIAPLLTNEQLSIIESIKKKRIDHIRNRTKKNRGRGEGMGAGKGRGDGPGEGFKDINGEAHHLPPPPPPVPQN